MPSTSIAQQKLFGMALAYKRGDLNKCSEKIKELADSMSEKELKKYASTSHEDLPDAVKESAIECISEMDNEALDIMEAFIIEAESKNDLSKPVDVKQINAKPDPVKVSDKSIVVDVKKPSPVVENPEIPPGYIKSDKRKDPGFFTPSLFRRPGDDKSKSERRVMDFEEFLKRINYRTHDGILQKGHGQNLTGG